ncbi:MAG: cysteine desulfurase [Rudaea sp.]
MLNDPSSDILRARSEFPFFAHAQERRWTYLDSAATTQKPNAVIDAMSAFYRDRNTQLDQSSTHAYDDARRVVAEFLGAPHTDDVVFCGGATTAINLVAQTWGRENIRAADEIVVSGLEHHANLAPWFALAQSVGASVRVAPLARDGEFRIDELRDSLSSRTKLVAVTHASNVLGSILPVGDIAALAHQVGAKILVDGAQAIAHVPVSVSDLDVDFYICSAHKAYGPNGIGALYIKRSLVDAMPPWQLGWNSTPNAALDAWTIPNGPARFETASANIAGAIGMGEAFRFLRNIGLDNVSRHEQKLNRYAREKLSTVPNLRWLGADATDVPIHSFVIDGRSAEDIGAALSKRGVQIRAGHLSALPLMRHLGIDSALRVSFGLYNNREDVQWLADGLNAVLGDLG